jgi:hypothetical protein
MVCLLGDMLGPARTIDPAREEVAQSMNDVPSRRRCGAARRDNALLSWALMGA